MDTSEARIYTAVLITAIVLGIIIVYFIVSIILSQRKNMRLHKEYMQAEIAGLEKDRTRIAADLHDELGPLLSAIKMKINSFELSDEDDIEQVSKTNNHIDAVLKRLREISFNLMPNSLLRKGLVSAVKEFVDYVRSNTSINFQLNYQNEFEIHDQKAIHLYRLVQEIIHNAIKHSAASMVTINLQQVENKVEVVISDNGKGFNYENAKNNPGIGLRSILTRSQIIGAETKFESKEGEGTSYTIMVDV